VASRRVPRRRRAACAFGIAAVLGLTAACASASGTTDAGKSSPSGPWSPPPTPGPAANPNRASQPEVTDSPSATSAGQPATTAPASGGQAGLPPGVGNGWHLVDSDDFNGGSLDTKKWQVYNAKSTNQVSAWSPDLVWVSDGQLQIAGKGSNPSGDGNVSGGVCWCSGNGNQTYGIWQVRAKFENGKGYGQAILLWPQSGRWPQDGELDFVEAPRATKDVAYGTVHWGDTDTSDETELHGDYTEWHTYTVEWRPDRVRMFIDNQVLYDSAASKVHPVIPHTPMQLAIQQEPGPFSTNWVPRPDTTTPDQVVMHIDWVKIYH
jgi:hypothetical protein